MVCERIVYPYAIDNIFFYAFHGYKLYAVTDDIFSYICIVGRFASICLILVIVAHMDLEVHQMDVKTFFFNGELNEEIYMEQPIGFIIQGQ